MKRNAPIAKLYPSLLWCALTGVALLTSGVFLNAAENTPAPAASRVARPLGAPMSDAEMQAARMTSQAREKKWEEEAVLELVGIGRVAGEPVGLMAVNGNLCAIMRGLSLAGRNVEEIEVENGRVVLRRRDKSSTVLTLATANPIKLPAMPAQQVEFLLSKEGIKQTNAFRGLPMEVHRTWGERSREGQAEVLLDYLKQGLVVGVPRQGESYAGKLFEQQIIRRRTEKRNAFVASLTDEQKTAYMAGQPLIRLSDPAVEREKQVAAAKAAETRRAEMLTGLSPEQRALYDEYQSWVRP